MQSLTSSVNMNQETTGYVYPHVKASSNNLLYTVTQNKCTQLNHVIISRVQDESNCRTPYVLTTLLLIQNIFFNITEH